MRIGVDVGGTNTDAVVMDGDRLVGAAKTRTTDAANIGIVLSIKKALKAAGLARSKIRAAMIGTTRITNALAERRNLTPTAIVRLCLPANRAVRPMIDWPADIAAAVGDHVYWAPGGAEFNGETFSPLDEDKIRRIGRDVHEKGLRHIAITGMFSPVNDAMEQRAAAIILEDYPHMGVTLSHHVGGLGFVERENAAILNAALGEIGLDIVAEFTMALKKAKISAPMFISQNDGTLMTADWARQYPIFMAKSGPTNSMIGAAHLSGVRNAVVVDIGGTTTDVGALFDGAPREKSLNTDLCDIRTNFRMPDTISIALGGGSKVAFDPALSIGPGSVARNLERRGVIFGGDVLTATDIAVGAGRLKLGDRNRLGDISPEKIIKADRRVQKIVAAAAEQMNLVSTPAEIILVGGGECLIGQTLKHAKSVSRPQYGNVANAVGAAVARIGGEDSRIVSYWKKGREKAIDKAFARARKRAAEAGADPETVETVAVEETSLSDRPGDRMRLRVKAAGKIMI